ncbi:MAG: glycosyltransferase family 39 protein [Firmicutes bacterium]|nr:glycosyltransferase family 39 protein [Bacillota bacterium]
MTAITVIIILCIIAGFAAWQYYFVPSLGKNQTIKKDNLPIIIVLAAAFIVRLICAIAYKGHETDINCFTSWANTLYTKGVNNFYDSAGFTDYPPGYMYILYVVGALKNWLNISGTAYVVLVKLPAIAADLISCLFIYKIASKKLSPGVSAALSALYAFNPAVITAGALWGQVDSVYTLAIMFMVWFISERKLFPAYLCFAACILIKPHAFIYTPLIAYAIVENYIYPEFKPYELLKTVGLGLCAIALMVLAAVPFGFQNVIEQYIKTLSEYNYMTINAFNLWGALDKNWSGLTAPAAVAGYVFLALIVAYATYVFFKSKSRSKYYFTAALLAFLTFMFSTKMHERYAFPVMLFLLLAFIDSKTIHNYAMYFTITASQFFNIAWILFVYQQDINKYAFSSVVNVASFINLALTAYMIYVSQKLYVGNETSKYDLFERRQTNVTKKGKGNKAAKSTKAAKAAPRKEFHFKRSVKLPKLQKIDFIIIAAVMVVYSAVALYDLGDTSAAETTYLMPQGQAVTIDLDGERSISSLKMFLGPRQLNSSDRALTITCVDESENVTYENTLTDGAVFYWSTVDINADASKITLYTSADDIYINEIGLLDENSELISPVSYSDSDAALMFDEQDQIPERQSFRNSTYFDEIYHARTAYEFIHHLSVYEWTHPPLGKIIISLGIMIFGMCPFGWRIAGTVVGILMIPVIYIFARKLLKKWQFALITCLLFTFDFMHFAQTRIATIDVYVTFFIMLMYLFMFKYYNMSFYDTPLKKTLAPLAVCGTVMGFAIASKWTGIYAAVGLAIIFFYTLFMRWREYTYALKNPKGETDGISHRYVIDSFRPCALKTIGWCCIFFVAVPLVIYCLSYIPYLLVPNSEGISVLWTNQEAMLTYHGKTVLDSTHPYSSKWYEWIIMKRPIWYYSGTVSDGIKEGISSFGNPAVWWMFIPAFVFIVYKAITKKDKICIFLIISYVIQLIPWMAVERVTFIYHYFPCVPFIVLTLGYSIKLIYDDAKERNKRKVLIGAFVYAGAAIALFALFYPVLSGQPCSTEFAKTWLKWFDSWVLL